MKRLFFLCALSGFLSACGDKENSNSDKTPPNERLRESFEKWKKNRPDIYSYQIVNFEDEASIWSQTVSVKGKEILCRRFSNSNGFTLYETQGNVNQDDTIKPLAITVDDLYERCLNRLSDNGDLKVVYFEETGYLQGCYLSCDENCSPEDMPLHKIELGIDSCTK